LSAAPGEKQIIGSIEKIECRRGITYLVKTATESFTLASRDFEALRLRSYVPEGKNRRIGCAENVSSLTAVMTFQPSADPKSQARGELTDITFVPKNFRFIDLSIPQDPLPPGPMIIEAAPNETVQAQSRAAMLQLIKDSLRKPGLGEKRQM